MNTFRLDAETLKAVEALQSKLGASSVAEVIRKSLALAKFATEHVDADSNLVLTPPNGPIATLNLKT